MQVPDLLSYPPIHDLNTVPELKDRMVYIIKEYDQNGISVLILNKDGEVRIKFGDWNGSPVDLNDTALRFMQEYGERIIDILQVVGVPQCLLYITSDLKLVDIRLSLNKFSGPGMVRDLFSKIMPTQEVLKVEILDDQVIESINQGTGTYSGNLIIKSSTFGTVVRDKEMIPLYAIVKRD